MLVQVMEEEMRGKENASAAEAERQRQREQEEEDRRLAERLQMQLHMQVGVHNPNSPCRQKKHKELCVARISRNACAHLIPRQSRFRLAEAYDGSLGVQEQELLRQQRVGLERIQQEQQEQKRMQLQQQQQQQQRMQEARRAEEAPTPVRTCRLCLVVQRYKQHQRFIGSPACL
jgi:hypothetical protein